MKSSNSGIYGIYHKETKLCLYVGQSINFIERFRKHRRKLITGSHLASFSEWFEGRKLEELDFVVLEVSHNQEELDSLEIKWFHSENPKFYGKVPAVSDWRMTEETRAKISASIQSNWLKANPGEKVSGMRTKRCAACGSMFSTRKRKQFLCSVSCNFDTRRSSITLEEILPLYERGDSLRSIAERFGVSRMAVSRTMDRAGIVRRPKTEQPRSRGAVQD